MGLGLQTAAVVGGGLRLGTMGNILLTVVCGVFRCEWLAGRFSVLFLHLQKSFKILHLVCYTR